MHCIGAVCCSVCVCCAHVRQTIASDFRSVAEIWHISTSNQKIYSISHLDSVRHFISNANVLLISITIRKTMTIRNVCALDVVLTSKLGAKKRFGIEWERNIRHRVRGVQAVGTHKMMNAIAKIQLPGEPSPSSCVNGKYNSNIRVTKRNTLRQAPRSRTPLPEKFNWEKGNWEASSKW